MKEKLELVTDFGSLKAGMIVVVKPCFWCGRPERGVLLRPFAPKLLAPYPNEQAEISDGWERLPHGCMSHVITRRSVSERRLYRVVDGLEQSTESRKSVTA